MFEGGDSPVGNVSIRFRICLST